MDDNGAVDTSKQAYGHAFVLLAAASAMTVGHPLAAPMLADISEVLDARFWEAQHGASAEEFAPDWTPVPGYRGQNANMHLTEALMAAFEATGERLYLDRAESIADLVIRRSAGDAGWRVPEHYTEAWRVDPAYQGNEMFRPAGTTPGHALEWSRLLLPALVPRRQTPRLAAPRLRGALRARHGPRLGRDARRPVLHARLGRPPAPPHEALVAALRGHRRRPFPQRPRPRPGARGGLPPRSGAWSRAPSSTAATAAGRRNAPRILTPAFTLFPGKADIYHALQACLIPLYPATASLTRVIAEARDPRLPSRRTGARSAPEAAERAMSPESADTRPGQIVQANGTDIFYREHGQGRPLVLLHGGTVSGDSWEPYPRGVRRALSG